MTTLWVISYIVLWAIVLGSIFLLLGTLRSLGLLQWKFDELVATRPLRKGREGLPVGQQAPDFTLPSTIDHEISLSDFSGRKVLLVFTQVGCGPCLTIAPELNRVQAAGTYQVLVVNHGERNETQAWIEEIDAHFPIITQNDWGVSKKYQVFATPYAFVVNEEGIVAAKGIASTPSYIRYLLEAVAQRGAVHQETSVRESTVDRDSSNSVSPKEMIHA